LGVLLALGLGVGWWLEHNHREREIGVAECQTQVAAAVKTQIDKQNAAALVAEGKLNAIAADYTRALADAHGVSYGLAQRLHDDQIRRCPVPRAAAHPAAAPDPAPQSSGDGGITAATQSVLDACSADAAQLSALEAAVGVHD